MTTDALILGLHLLSFHADPGMHTVTPGIYAQFAQGETVGAFRNSEGGKSAYAGWTFYRGDAALTVGAVTGYRRAAVLPLVVPSYKLRFARLSVVPNPVGPWALHLSVERSL